MQLCRDTIKCHWIKLSRYFNEEVKIEHLFCVHYYIEGNEKWRIKMHGPCS